MKVLMIQPIENDINKPTPYPWIIKDAGKAYAEVIRQDFWKGKPLKFIGFTRKGVQEVFIYPDEIFARMVINFKNINPVFMDKDGEIWNSTCECSFKFEHINEVTK